MWIEQKVNKQGKKVFKYNERYFEPKTKSRKKVSVTLANKSRETQKEAQKLLEVKIDHKLSKKRIKKPELTFHNLIDEWLPFYSHQVKESTYLSTKDLLNTVKKNIPENWVASGVTTTDLNEMLEKLLYTDNLSNRYVSIIKGKINKVFAFAVKKQYVLSNPVDEVKIDYKLDDRSGKIKDKFLEDDEYERLISYVDPHNKRYSLLFQWLYLTGMRPGEAIALHKEDVYEIEDEGFYVNINGTILNKGRKIKEMKKSNSTKNNAGMREITIPQKAVEIYDELLAMNPKGHFLFQTTKGTPIQITAINTYLRDHKGRMEIDKPLSSHIFRHTHISKLAELGVPLYVIQDRVGHEHSDITEKIYTHVTKNAKKRLRENLEKL